MAKNIEPKLKKIGDYLKLEEDTVFTIPEYQRAYSWGIDNCDKLWQDINDFVESESKDRYFFGTIIINCQDNDTKYGLIDGQQRTTTFLLLLKALLVRINIAIERTASDEDSASLCRGLQERRRRIMGILYKAETEDISDKPDAAKDAEICRRGIILENFSINEQYKTELSTILQATDYASAEARVIKIKYKQKDNRYTNFFRNFKFFYGKISELSDSQLNSIAKSITDNCEVIEIKSWQVEQAITMFNSLNSDGLPLYDSDIISAKLYAEAEKRGKEKEFADLWKQLNNCINELESTRIADINSILMQYMYYIRTVNKETISETGAINVTTPGLRRYFTEVNKMPITDPIGMCSDMVKLVKVWKKVSEYPQMKVLLKFNENTKLLQLTDLGTRDTGTFDIREVMYHDIRECDIFVADLTGARHNVMIEVGYALKHIDTGRMVFYFQETDSCKNVPFDVNHFSYDKIEDSVEIKTKTKARIMKILEQAKNGEI